MKRLLWLPILMFMVAWLAAETVQTGAGINSAEVLSSSPSETVLHFQVGSYEKTKLEIEGEDWYEISLPKEGRLLKAGLPELPVFNRSIIIDDQALMKVEVFDIQYVDTVLPIAPSKGDLTRDIDPSTVPFRFDPLYNEDKFWPEEVATLSEPYIMRDFRGIVVRTAPFAYNPATNTLRTYISYKVRVYAQGSDTVNVLTKTRTEISREFVSIYENHFLNWDSYRYVSVSDNFGRLLIIYYDDFYNDILPYYQWKRQKGIVTYLVPMSDVGTTATDVQTFIQTYYTSYSIDFVQLVGDAAQIPTLIVGGGGSDPSYALVAGGDNYPDIFIGRFSSTTANANADLITQVNKVLTYERDFTTAQTWLQWATGVASDQGPGDDGEYDWEHMDNIRSDLLGYGYTIVDRVYPNNPPCDAATLSSYLNGGSGVLNYCGHGWTEGFSTTGFSNTHVAALTNGVKTPIICSVACLNGNFVSYTCLGEAFLRKSGGGGIAFYGSSVNQSWSPPMSAQDEVADLMIAESKKTVGGLFFNGACKMLDDYAAYDMFKTWNIFGDVSLLVRTKNPSNMTVTHNNVIPVGQSTSITVSTGVPYAHVGITYGTTIASCGYANVAGNFTTSITPSTFREYTVTVTAQNYVTYVGTIYAGIIWEGNSNAVWTYAPNWNAGVAPTSSDDVLIPNGCVRYPLTYSAVGYCRNLTIQSTANVLVNAYDLIVSGSITNYGQLRMDSSTDLEVSGNISWESGSTVSVTNTTAEIYCYGDMTFKSGSNVQFTMGYIEFCGTASNCYLINQSSATQLNNLRSDMGDGYVLIFHDTSTQDFVLNGSLWNYDGSSVYFWYTGDITLKGNYLSDFNSGTYGIKLYYGTLILDGNSQTVTLNGGSCYLNNLVVSSTIATTLAANLTLRANLTLETGVLNAGSYTITLGGNWVNPGNPNYFSEGTSTVVFNGSGHQYCNNTENFNNLVVNKSGGALRVNNTNAVVTCASYDWMAGAVDVLTGTFTASSLAANYIEGAWYLNATGTINLYGNTGYIDLGGELHIFGGEFNVYGGSLSSYWPYYHDAFIEMSDGILQFHDRGVWIINVATWTFSENVTGGTIRVPRNFTVDRTEWTPTGGTVEMFGSLDATISHVAGANFHEVKINKYATRDGGSGSIIETDRDGRSREIYRTNTVTATTDLDVNGIFRIDAGVFVAPAQMNVGSCWYNAVGPAAFTEGTGLVVLDGSTSCYIYEETFYALELNKPGGIWIGGSDDITCVSYNWTSGSLNVEGGTFTALDMVDDHVYGTINLSAGQINFHQDPGQYLDIQANISISGGELHLYGGTPAAYTFIPHGGDAGLIMSGGLLYRHDDAIYVSTSYTLTNNITGGIIRTDSHFICYRSDFTPTGGAIEMVGSNDANLSMYAGNIYNLVIDKAPAGKSVQGKEEQEILTGRDGTQTTNTRSQTVMLTNDLVCNGDISIDTGTLTLNTFDINCAGDVLVYGTLNVDEGACLYMTLADGIFVYSGGRLEVIGIGALPALISKSTGAYYLYIYNGATIAAENAIFEYMSSNGVNVQSGATVDPAYSFTNCTFRYGIVGGTLLTLNNNANILISGANFPTNAGTGSSNVRKTTNTGIVNMSNATGVFAGESFDGDSYNRIFWNTATAAFDMQILKATWSPVGNPYLGDTRVLTVTVLNSSTTPFSGTCWLDLYYDLDVPPVEDQSGQQFQTVSPLPAGLPVDLVFSVANYDESLAGLWNSYLFIDSFGNVTEANEGNNILGPFNITWLDLPLIADLAISYDAVDDDTVLDWTYPISVSRFNIYYDTNPYGTFSSLMGTSTIGHFEDTTPGPRRFYQVKAERIPPARDEQLPARE
jgi:hypothetical protein